jgi:hypothetical protein
MKGLGAMFVCILLSIWLPVGSGIFAVATAVLFVFLVISAYLLAKIEKQ